MNEQKFVSLWAGTLESDQALDKYLEFVFDEDGDADPCPFGKDFGIDWFDEDFLEAGFKDAKTRSLQKLLAGHSYAKEIAIAFTQRVGNMLPFEANVIIMLFEYSYDGAVTTVDYGQVQLSFLGTVPY